MQAGKQPEDVDVDVGAFVVADVAVGHVWPDVWEHLFGNLIKRKNLVMKLKK